MQCLRSCGWFLKSILCGAVVWGGLFSISIGSLPEEAAAERSTRAERTFKKQCRTTQRLPNQFIYKTVGSVHFTGGDCRRNTIGMILAFGARGANGSCADVIDKKGNILAKLGNYGQPWVGGPGRFYNCIGCAKGTALDGFDVARKAAKNTKSKDVYIRFSGNSKVCYGPFPADRCQNASSC